jgi:hypothetical protein
VAGRVDVVGGVVGGVGVVVGFGGVVDLVDGVLAGEAAGGEVVPALAEVF